MGIEVDIEANVLRIAPDNLHEIHQERLQVCQKTHLSKRQYQSLLGKLLYIQKCVKPLHIFINKILSIFRSHSIAKTIWLIGEFYQDLDWFITFLPQFNDFTNISRKLVDYAQSLNMDACLTGMGAVWWDRVYATPIVQIPNFILTTVHLEMLNIVIALRTWAKYWQHTRVVLYCDTLAVVHVVETNRTRDNFLALCLRNIWLLAALHDVEVEVKHISGKNNQKADVLSRIYSSAPVDEWILRDLQENYICANIPVITGVDQSTSDLVKRALFCTESAYRPSTPAAVRMHLRKYLAFVIYMGIQPDITIQTILSFLEFLHLDSVSPRVIANYVSSLKTVARRYKLDPEPLSHQLVSVYLRSITINSTFNPTPRGAFDLNTLASISKPCDILQDPILYRAVLLLNFLPFYACLMLPYIQGLNLMRVDIY